MIRPKVEPLDGTDDGFKLGDPLAVRSTLRTNRYWRRRMLAHAAGQYELLALWQEQLSCRDKLTIQCTQRSKQQFAPLEQKGCREGD